MRRLWRNVVFRAANVVVVLLRPPGHKSCERRAQVRPAALPALTAHNALHTWLLRAGAAKRGRTKSILRTDTCNADSRYALAAAEYAGRRGRFGQRHVCNYKRRINQEELAARRRRASRRHADFGAQPISDLPPPPPLDTMCRSGGRRLDYVGNQGTCCARRPPPPPQQMQSNCK